MKAYYINLLVYLTLSNLFISCSKDSEKQTLVNQSSLEVRIGDIVTLTGSNLSEIQNLYFFSEDVDYGAQKIDDYRFISQTDDEIQFKFPRVNSENYMVRIAGKNIPVKVKGFIPLGLFDAETDPLEKEIVIIDDKTAFITLNDQLYLLYDNYYSMKPLANSIADYGSLRNGDSWYITKSQDHPTLYKAFYKKASEVDYSKVNEFTFPGLNPDSERFLITEEMEILAKTRQYNEGLTYYIKGDEVIYLEDKIKDLPDISNESQYEIYDFELLSNGEVFCHLNYSGNHMVLNLNTESSRFLKYFSDEINFYNSNLVQFTNDKVFLSSDYGHSWDNNNHDIEIDITIGNSGTEVEFLDSNTFLVFQFDQYIGSGSPHTMAYLSNDQGKTWDQYEIFEESQEIWELDFRENYGLVFFRAFGMFGKNELYKYVK